MQKYGQIIDDSFDPYKNDTYQLFTEYFENPIMTKIKDVEMFSVYVSKIHCLLNNVYRYLMVFVNKDNFPVNRTDSLSNINWIYLHTRTLNDRYNVKTHSYQSRRFEPLMKAIKQFKVDDEGYYYSVNELPLQIILLSSKPGKFEYSNTGTVVTALETYNTILSWK